MKKIAIISIIIILSFFTASTSKSFIVNAELLIPFLFTILGLTVTAYTFIYAPISEILKKESMKNDESKQKLQKLLNSFEEDMMLIFFLTIATVLSKEGADAGKNTIHTELEMLMHQEDEDKKKEMRKLGKKKKGNISQQA